jgi:hypothetical protein
MRWSGMDWIDLAQEHGNGPSGAVKVGKFSSGCTTGGFPRRVQLRGVG